jgi:hypothetical protein
VGKSLNSDKGFTQKKWGVFLIKLDMDLERKYLTPACRYSHNITEKNKGLVEPRAVGETVGYPGNPAAVSNKGNGL